MTDMTATKKTAADEPAKKKEEKPAAKKAASKKIVPKAVSKATGTKVKKAPAGKKVEEAAKPAVVAAPVAAPEPKRASVVGTKEWIYALGRRKTAIAQVRYWPGKKGIITVNGKPYDKYFTVFDLQQSIVAPLKAVGKDEGAEIAITCHGGGLTGQAEAARLGISRALVKLNEEFRKSLKKAGFLMRDPRAKERKKYGLKKARKAAQWAKR